MVRVVVAREKRIRGRVDTGNSRSARPSPTKRAARRTVEGSTPLDPVVLRAVVEGAPDSLIVSDAKGRIVLANRETERMFGFSRAELLGKSVELLMPERIRDLHKRERANFHRSPRPRAMGSGRELFGRRKDGLELPIDVSLSSMKGATGTFDCASIRDMSEKFIADLALRNMNRSLRTISECNQLLVKSEEEGELLRELCNILAHHGGYQLAWVGFASTEKGRPVVPVARAGSSAGYLDGARVTWDDGPEGRGPTGRAIRSGRTVVAKRLSTDPSYGPWRDRAIAHGLVSSAAVPLLIAGRVIGALCLYSADPDRFVPAEVRLIEELGGDLAYGLAALRTREEKRLAEKKVESSERRFRALVENSQELIAILGPDGKLLYESPSYLAVTGYTPQERERLTPKDMVPPEDREKTKSILAELFAEPGANRTLDTRVLRKDGSVRLLAGFVTNRTDDPALGGLVFNFRDVTEERLARDQLKSHAEELARSNRELEQFAYVASHDLQEPLRVVASYVQLLQKRYAGKLGEEADEFITNAVAGANRMHALINDLLAYSRVGRGPAKREAVDLAVALDRAMTALKLQMEESGARLSREALPVVAGDPSQIEIVLQNLLSNAFKFRGPDEPQVHVSASRVENDWVVSVRDNGIGVEPAHRDRIFDLFQRLNPRDKFEGTGLGLAICKKIVEAQGGRIWVESEPGAGANFRFSLPDKR